MEHIPATHPREVKLKMLRRRQKDFLRKHQMAYAIVRKLVSGGTVETRAYRRYEQRSLWNVLRPLMESSLPVIWYKEKTPENLVKEIGPEYWVFELMQPHQQRRYGSAQGYRDNLHKKARADRSLRTC